MPTKLNRLVSRETNRKFNRRPVIVTLAPSGDETLIGFHLKGTRTQYICTLDSIYRMAALWHGNKVARARREARKNGEPWRKAKKRFDSINRIGLKNKTLTPYDPPQVRRTPD